jgi:hypothetical protein
LSDGFQLHLFHASSVVWAAAFNTLRLCVLTRERQLLVLCEAHDCVVTSGAAVCCTGQCKICPHSWGTTIRVTWWMDAILVPTRVATWSKCSRRIYSTEKIARLNWISTAHCYLVTQYRVVIFIYCKIRRNARVAMSCTAQFNIIERKGPCILRKMTQSHINAKKIQNYTKFALNVYKSFNFVFFILFSSEYLDYWLTKNTSYTKVNVMERRDKITWTCVRAAIVAVEKRKVLHNMSACN